MSLAHHRVKSAAYLNMQFVTDSMILKLSLLIHRYNVLSLGGGEERKKERKKGKLWTMLEENHGEKHYPNV